MATKIAIIYDSSTEYSSGIREAFVAEAANQGLEIVADEAFSADSNTDFSVQLDKAKTLAQSWYSFRSTIRRLPSS